MEFAGGFVPVAGQVGLLSMVAYYCIFAAVFALGAAFVFFLAAEKRVAPEHRSEMILSALIVGVAAVSYYLIRGFFQDALRSVANAQDPAAQRRLIQNAYLAVGQYRYVDWLITTPLLLLKTVLVLEAKPRKLWGALTILLLADVFMVVTGYIGEQQFSANGSVDVQGRLFWGFIATIGYVIIPITLLYIYRRFKAGAHPWERRAFKILAFATVTTWGVYPLGYLVPALWPQLSYNWINIVFSIADVLNKVGAGVVIYIGAARVLEDRVPKDATRQAREVA